MSDPIRKLAWLVVLALALLTTTGKLAASGLLESAELFLHLFAIVAAPLIVACIAVSPRVIRCLVALAAFKLGFADFARSLMNGRGSDSLRVVSDNSPEIVTAKISTQK